MRTSSKGRYQKEIGLAKGFVVATLKQTRRLQWTDQDINVLHDIHR
jgi:hypothetical protein